MVVVYRPDIDKYIKCEYKYWFKTLKKFYRKIISSVNQSVAFQLSLKASNL